MARSDIVQKSSSHVLALKSDQLRKIIPRPTRVAINTRNIASVLVTSAGALLIGLLAILAIKILTLLTLLIVAGTILLARPNALIYSTVISATVAVPSPIPVAVPIAGIQVRVYEPLLALSVLYLLVHRWQRSHKGSGERSLTLAVMVPMIAATTISAMVGVVLENPFSKIFSETRSLLVTVLSLVFGTLIVRETKILTTVTRMVPTILVVSGISTIGASLDYWTVSGQQSDISGSTAEVARVVTPATYLAVVFICGVTSAYISGAHTPRGLPIGVILVTALPVAVLSFSRNVILAFGVSIVFGLVVGLSIRALSRAGVVAVISAIPAGILALVTILLPPSRLTAWLNSAADLYSKRVLDGISENAIAIDRSAQFRFQQENPYLYQSISDRPLLGGGAGFAYKPIHTGRAISDKSDDLRYYAHDLYLWMLTKMGIVGTALFLLPVIVSLAIGYVCSRHRYIYVFAGGASVSLLAVCAVAPLPLTLESTFVFGATLGLVVGSVSFSRNYSVIVRPSACVEKG
ncbi:O-antigen ligase-like protein [Gordonia polyisoprenivorans VH2]|uniref:O-antigen ligase-like protein n=1 Tax=Gordonia polyisoprenivorans (strain DSM 44266 / VH2) TaxID=1112204 RepID=H6N1G5_GORPV|nr:O-antigen ligase family protein [Gordonia polyisoprenivorans]AFA72176.1 O-antigen ligase-like protein [Gordonia polyisoprenivorans VH2]